MAKTSSRLDINLEASGKIKSIMLRSISEVTKSWKEKESEEEGSMARYYRNVIDVVKGSSFREETLLLHPEWLSIDLALFSKAAAVSGGHHSSDTSVKH